MILRGLVLFLQAKLPDALAQLVDLLKLDPDNEKAKTLRSRVKSISQHKDSGNESYRDGDWHSAAQSWTTALEVSFVVVIVRFYSI